MHLCYMNDYIEYYKKMISHSSDIYANIANMTVYIKQNVFDPDPTITYTTMFIIKNLRTTFMGPKIILDMGCGSGVIGIYCLKLGAKHVCFVDNDEIAIRNTIINTSDFTNKTIIKSDLFENIKKTKYDIIFFNYPVCDGDWNKNVIRTLKKYCKKLKSYMHETSCAYCVFASFGNVHIFENILKKYKFLYDISNETRFGVSWSLFTIKKGSSDTQVETKYHTHRAHHTRHSHHSEESSTGKFSVNPIKCENSVKHIDASLEKKFEYAMKLLDETREQSELFVLK